MTEIPNDLVPLPTQPYDVRPAELPLDIEECRTAIWRKSGNVTEAAKLLKVPSSRLRRFIKNSPYLQAEVQEALDQIIDIAEDNVREALIDEEDKSRRDHMSKFVLGTIGRARGWGNGGGSGSVTVNNTGNIIVTWGDGTPIGADTPAEMKTIDHE